jgi:hypothetical protein
MPQYVKLTGPVEEQAAQLYDLAVTAMEEGRYSGAYRYFLEIENAVPGFRDVPERLRQADYARREQRFLALGSFAGAIILVIAARLLSVQNELVFLGVAVVGLVLGFLVTLFLYPRLVRRPTAPTASE